MTVDVVKKLTPSTPAVPDCCTSRGSAPYWSNPAFLISDIWALWSSVLSARAPECQKLKMVGLDQYDNGIGGERVKRGRATGKEALSDFYISTSDGQLTKIFSLN